VNTFWCVTEILSYKNFGKYWNQQHATDDDDAMLCCTNVCSLTGIL
jgi:hypothetical protein